MFKKFLTEHRFFILGVITGEILYSLISRVPKVNLVVALILLFIFAYLDIGASK